MNSSPLLVILGPTASGKTRLAVQVARLLEGEIISADSRQVYRGMDIGTGKDLDEYTTDNQTVPYHLIDVVNAGDDYNLHRYQQDFRRAVADIQNRGHRPIVCGGTGLYIEAVLKGHAYTAIPVNEPLRAALDTLTDEQLTHRFHDTPSAYSPVADTSTRKRLIRAVEISTYLNAHPNVQLGAATPAYEARLFGIDVPVELRRQRISTRLRHRLQHGMIEEVEQLLAQGVPAEKLVFYGLEYKFITQYLSGELDYNTMATRLETAIHQFAKRQMTFFRKMERDGLLIHWLDGTQPTEVLSQQITTLITG
ncbi:tRNA (adenosine(37)-N6)-dimethylallyltransferase MiaA [Rudanella paleaurantiibacter]|uniref:tRNA dimethylallyltransferase n=1 Tax=Rudanella paleaurantiibacter TaxID=2614655 RepID=A0A7J5U0E1_9BACT|nr:tRNA (adenosine(37)-N6)-dimethylallyltransferase MiaA [Rudanella paleaurantiibacter]KAB7731223.1 tRNA (adenosine(37)-N6)-dimethylallyltransferase MiaA [Rudanella paleaurantiibacter]